MNKLCKLIPLLLVVLTACNKHSLGIKGGKSISSRTRNVHNRPAPRVYPNPAYLDPKTDLTFKRIFKTDKEVTASFLNSILELTGYDTIEIESFGNTENVSSGREPKVTYFDILVKDKRGNHYIIEMQLAYEAFFKKRVTYYAADKYSEQLRKGGGYELLNKVVCLTIAGHKLFRDDLEEFGKMVHKKSYRREHLILDKETYQHDLKDLSWVFIEIPKFNKSIDNLEDNEDRWCAFLRGDVQTEEDSEKISGHDIYIEKAINQLKSCNYTEAEMDEYRSNLIQIANQNVTERQKQEIWIKEVEEKAKKEFEKERKKEDKDMIQEMLDSGNSIDMIIRIFRKRKYNDSEINNMINEAIEENKAN